MKQLITLFILTASYTVATAQLETMKQVIGNSNAISTGGNYTNISVIGEPVVGISTQGTIKDNKAGFIWTRICRLPKLGIDTIVCNGGTLALDSKVPNASYLWNTSETSSDIQVSTSGEYIVTVTEVNGCIRSDTINVIINPPITSSAMLVDSVQCHGGSDGQAIALSNGGSGSYSYHWENSSTDLSYLAVALSAGNNRVFITDGNGCKDTTSVFVPQPLPLVGNTIMNNPTLCYGDNNGIATANPSGGVGNYTYIWDDNSTTTAQNSNLGAGWHSITITDGNFCSIVDNVLITEPSELVANAYQVEEVHCYGTATGKANVNVTGGVAPYTFSWTSIDSTQLATNLNAMVHTVTVTDANGCQTTDTVLITQKPALALVTTPVAPTCNNGSNGVATVAVSGGTPFYSYQWDNFVETTDTAFQLTGGLHFVTVTDAYGCSKVASVIVDTLTGFYATVDSFTNVSCKGLSDGSAIVSVIGGNPPFSYLWSNGSTNQQAIGLSVGTYYVTVTDKNGCYSNASVNIFEPNELNTAINFQNVSCFGYNNGSIDLTITGGTGLYNTQWLDGTTSTDRSSLQAGWYHVTVTDANGCQATDSILINEPPQLTGNLTSNPDTCGVWLGETSINVNGGVLPYTYNFSIPNPNIQGDSLIMDLVAGNYTLTVTDYNQCEIVLNTTVPYFCDSCLLFSPITIDAVTFICEGEHEAYLQIDLTGGGHEFNANYPYFLSFDTPLWDDDIVIYEDYFEIPIQNGATYSITASDATGCSSDTLTGTFIESPATCSNFCELYPLDVVTSPDTIMFLNDEVRLRVSPTEQIFWHPSSTLSCSDCPNPIAIPTETTQYIVAATDSDGCIDIDTIKVEVHARRDAKLVIKTPKLLTPDNDQINDLLVFENLEYFDDNHLVIVNIWGNKVLEQSSYNNSWDGTFNGEPLPQGTYYYQLTTNIAESQTLTGYFTILR